MTQPARGPAGSSSRPPLEWKEAKRFTSADGEVAVAIETTDGFRPRYSVRLGRVRPDGKLAPFLPVKITGDLQPKLVAFLASYSKLLADAEEWISIELGYRAEGDLDRRIVKETQQANFGKPVTKVTGKTAKKKARLAARSSTPPTT